MEDQQKLQQILAQLEVYKSQSELYQTQIDAVQTSLAEIKVLESTLDDISGKDTVETLVPLGAGSFINAEIKNENKVIYNTQLYHIGKLALWLWLYFEFTRIGGFQTCICICCSIGCMRFL